ncbi:YcaO-like family protein [Oricola cellulosilytica]|uniref:YcaO domain-containing protein n=1 Tax=Oricola cellulosilytica TaxID=1429082 RepID=A0A4R0PCN6_9HYPH|nr:YcaO-like family protein [Oricola cellulosilytica]TCD14059.1 hypothetical protein E0D97_08160 [Oricola cellulosilytica]
MNLYSTELLSGILTWLEEAGEPAAFPFPSHPVLAIAFEARASRISRPFLVSALQRACELPDMFELPVPGASKLTSIGATMPSADSSEKSTGANGIGFSPGEAFLACIGESFEHLATRSTGTVLQVLSGWEGGIARLAEPTPEQKERFLRFRARNSRQPPSEGAAVHASLEKALLAATLELVERDAAARWWREGVPASPLDLGRDGGADLAGRLSGAAGPLLRTTTFFRLSSEYPAHVVAAAHIDRTGRARAIGYAARLSVAEAVGRAFLEMAQVNLAISLTRLRMRHEPGVPPPHTHLPFLEGLDLPTLGPPDVSLIQPASQRENAFMDTVMRKTESVFVQVPDRAPSGVHAVRVTCPQFLSSRLGHSSVVPGGRKRPPVEGGLWRDVPLI